MTPARRRGCRAPRPAAGGTSKGRA
jgi:hypothetical protein